MANYTATQSGNWSNTATWGGTPPTTLSAGDIIRIPNGIAITIAQGTIVNIENVEIQLEGLLSLQGVLNLAVNNQTYSSWVILVGQQQSASFTVENSGQLNITAQGYAQQESYFPVNAIVLFNGSTLTNHGQINITCKTYADQPFTAIGRGYGIRMHDNAVFNNYGSVSITSQDPTGDGYGPSFGIYNNSGKLHNYAGGTITSDAPTTESPGGGTIFIGNTAKFVNEGSFNNFGQFWNQGAGENSGTIMQNYPGATYQSNGKITGNGTVFMQGTVKTPLSLDTVIPGQTNFTIKAKETLTLDAPFTVPANYTLICSGSIIQNDTFTNNGTIFWNFDTSRFTPHWSGQNDGKGTGLFVLSGTLTNTGEVDLNKMGRNFSIPNSVTVGRNSVLLIHNSLTVIIAANASLTTLDATSPDVPGTVSIGGIVKNNGSIVNSGRLKYLFPYIVKNGFINGNAPTGDGAIALSGPLGENLSLDTLPSKTFLILAGEELNVYQGLSLTISDGCTLTVEAGGDFPGTLDSVGPVVIKGKLINNGKFGRSAPVTIVHCFPTAAYSGNVPTSISKVSLTGSITSTIALGSIGYGVVAPYQIDENSTLTVAAQFTISAKSMLKSYGSLIATGTGSVVNMGTYVENFTTSSFACSNFSGDGSVALNGNITDVVSFESIIDRFTGKKKFIVRAGDSLGFCWPTEITSGVMLDIQGELYVYNGATLTLNTPPNPPNDQSVSATIALSGSGQLNNYGTIKMINTLNIGLWMKYLNSPKNVGTIDASTNMVICNDRNAALLVEGSTLANSGTINTPSNGATIYCNNGTICGGTFDGTKPIGSGPKGSPTYSSSCAS